MDRKELATLIDAFADAKMSKNEFLCLAMIEKLEKAMSEIFDTPEE